MKIVCNRFINSAVWFTVAMLIFTAKLALAALPVAVDGQPLPSLAPMLERVQPAVVNISTTAKVDNNPMLNDPFFRFFLERPRSRRPQNNSLGSGVVVDAAKGLVITNHHVIDEAASITVTTHDGRELEATLVGSDPESDVAIIQVSADNLTALPIGDATALRVGDFVVAIGNPFGLSQTVTSGIVSALGRSGLGIEGYEDFIQTDASINPGNSGGALVNLHGELVGINTAIFSRSGGSVGIGFAIPMDMVQAIMTQLVSHGNVERGILGVQMQDISAEVAEAMNLKTSKGALIAYVLEQSSADLAGIRVGDILIQINGRDIANSSDARNAIGLVRAGSSIDIVYVRDGERRQVETIIKRHHKVFDHPVWGQRLTGVTFVDEEPNDVHDGGVRVTHIEPGTPAAQTLLRVGDIIVTANRLRVRNLQDLKTVINNSNRSLRVKVLRNRRLLLLVIE